MAKNFEKEFIRKYALATGNTAAPVKSEFQENNEFVDYFQRRAERKDN